MGDTLNNVDVLKKLGFDSYNQWIFYDDRFQQFFDYFTEFVSDSNILTEVEVLEKDELLQRQEYLKGADLEKQLQKIELDHPGFSTQSEENLTTLRQAVAHLQQASTSYAELVDDMRSTKTVASCRISELEKAHTELTLLEKERLTLCQAKCKQLETLQSDNYKLSKDCMSFFTKSHSPPLFVHQHAMEEYVLKLDSFMKRFTLYLKKNFKLEEFIELDAHATDAKLLAEQIGKLEKATKHYTMEYIKEEVTGRATQFLIDHLDMSKIHVRSLPDMKRETRDLVFGNEHNLKLTYDTLMHTLEIYVQQHAQYQAEFILYENTKQKLQRALKRQEREKLIAKIISDALSNAELMWISIQLDLEKMCKRFDRSKTMREEAKSCIQRIKIMRNLQSATADNFQSTTFLREVSTLLSEHLGQTVREEPKACLYEYEKFCRLLSYALQAILKTPSHTIALAQQNELNRLESMLKPFVYDGPVDIPILGNMRYLKPIFNVKMQEKHIENILRNMRRCSQEVTERMEKDKYWRYSRLLWVWFLTNPKKVDAIIEEIKNEASKHPSQTGIKRLEGIKRK